MYNKGNVNVTYSSKSGQVLLAIFLSTLIIIIIDNTATITLTPTRAIWGMATVNLFFIRLFHASNFQLKYTTEQTIHNETQAHHERAQPLKNTDTRALAELNRLYFQAKTTFKNKQVDAMSVMEDYFYFSHKSKQWQRVIRLGQAFFYLAISISIFVLSTSNQLFIVSLLTLAIVLNIEGVIHAYKTDKQAQIYKQKIDVLYKKKYSAILDYNLQ
ncbi:hypothetical protein DES38_11710 [Streptohalobacillus salinus]|uniref:Uncharacterized protein n=1 Tax=Streptohalobacillus salinus TaxID=621096 RepID=A0A2V3VZG3_9BACI|nr:hypothetical protein [Streptohalobacillus salinus]PXW87172.1 hypothetical protein DES38_11710 [Streptohalobacillus salinus]